MQQLILLVTLIFVFPAVNAQQQSSNEVVAEGAAKMKVKPDIAVFTLTMEKRDTFEKDAINKLSTAMVDLEKALNSIGISNKAIKIADYEVTSVYTNDGERKAYTATNILKLEFRINNKLIDAIYTQVQKTGIEDLDIEFDSKLSDSLEKASRHMLVQSAIQDAKANAATIANALGIKLGRVKQVQKVAYGLLVEKLEEIKFTPPRLKNDTEIKFKTSFDKFEIEDVELEERITVIYSIANS